MQNVMNICDNMKVREINARKSYLEDDTVFHSARDRNSRRSPTKDLLWSCIESRKERITMI